MSNPWRRPMRTWSLADIDRAVDVMAREKRRTRLRNVAGWVLVVLGGIAIGLLYLWAMIYFGMIGD